MIKKYDTVYLSGPMTGLPLFNYPNFFALEGLIRKEYKCTVLNPARQPDGMTYEDLMKAAIMDIAAADTVVMLDGWEKSNGAKLENSIARRKRMRILFQNDVVSDIARRMNERIARRENV